jgi:hypothetical protein
MAINWRAGAVLALGLAIGSALLTGCGSSSAGGGAPVTVTQGGSVTGTDLTITVDDGAGSVTTWHLTCDPPGGDHPDAEGACAALARNGAHALPEVPPNQMCTQIYGGPQTARITGTWDGKAVDASLKRTNGCETARWNALRPLLPAGGGN